MNLKKVLYLNSNSTWDSDQYLRNGERRKAEPSWEEGVVSKHSSMLAKAGMP